VKRREFVRTCAVGCGAALLPRVPLGRCDDQLVERWSWAMGQPVHVMVFATSQQQGLDACAAALAELRRVETRLTLFDDTSDVCELNRHAGKRAMHLDRDLERVLELADGFRQETNGGFNIAVEPLMRTWGFRTARSTEPTLTEIEAAREAVAAAVVTLEGNLARLPSAHTQIDLGGIGVGYGIDRALSVLRARRIRRAFLDVSGDCAALGTPPGEPGWRVDIADASVAGAIIATTHLRDAALATSANTTSVVRFGRAVRGHVMSPATGWPAHARRQATVVSRTAVAADALSTAMLVNGRHPRGALQVYDVA